MEWLCLSENCFETVYHTKDGRCWVVRWISVRFEKLIGWEAELQHASYFGIRALAIYYQKGEDLDRQCRSRFVTQGTELWSVRDMGRSDQEAHFWRDAISKRECNH